VCAHGHDFIIFYCVLLLLLVLLLLVLVLLVLVLVLLVLVLVLMLLVLLMRSSCALNVCQHTIRAKSLLQFTAPAIHAAGHPMSTPCAVSPLSLLRAHRARGSLPPRGTARTPCSGRRAGRASSPEDSASTAAQGGFSINFQPIGSRAPTQSFCALS
jgi:hypothetical protein